MEKLYLNQNSHIQYMTHVCNNIVIDEKGEIVIYKMVKRIPQSAIIDNKCKRWLVHSNIKIFMKDIW